MAGEVAHLHGYVQLIFQVCSSQTLEVTADVIPLTAADVIWGIPWLSDTNPAISWPDRVVQFKDGTVWDATCVLPGGRRTATECCSTQTAVNDGKGGETGSKGVDQEPTLEEKRAALLKHVWSAKHTLSYLATYPVEHIFFLHLVPNEPEPASGHSVNAVSSTVTTEQQQQHDALLDKYGAIFEDKMPQYPPEGPITHVIKFSRGCSSSLCAYVQDGPCRDGRAEDHTYWLVGGWSDPPS
eukprot:jgi/Mesvir1/8004/Mv25283-RA.1